LVVEAAAELEMVQQVLAVQLVPLDLALMEVPANLVNKVALVAVAVVLADILQVLVGHEVALVAATG
jgi:hypothetical protein